MAELGERRLGQRTRQRGTSFKEEGTAERNRRDGARGGKADEMEREIRKEDLK